MIFLRYFAENKLILYLYTYLIIIRYNLSILRMENRIKEVLADKKRTNKWLSEQLECAFT